MNMKNKIKYGLIFLNLIFVYSCSNYLNVVPDDIPTINHAFSNRAMAERYLYTCYSYLPNPASVNKQPTFEAGGECWVHYEDGTYVWWLTGAGAEGDIYAYYIATGLQNTNAPYLNFWEGQNGGTNLFIALRDCNIFLENINEVADMTGEEKAQWISEVKFLKAYYHFYLLRSYGPIPIIDQNLPVSSSVEDVRIYREPVDLVANYISTLLDDAATGLPMNVTPEIMALGRITKPAALALKAKLWMLMASPEFNGNSYYKDMVDSRGTHLFPTTYDATLWNKAAEATKEAIDCAQSAGRKLYYYPGFNPISDDTKAKLNIRGAVTDKWNTELIWGSTVTSEYGQQNTYLIQELALLRYEDGIQNLNNAASILAPTLQTVERFYSKNGVPIDEDKDYDYAHRYDIDKATDADKFFIKPGFETPKLNLNREIRYYGSLFFDGCAAYGNGVVTDDPPYYARMKKSQTGGMTHNICYSITGYLPQKVININTVSQAPNYWLPYGYAFPYIRLADLYLMYSEALNETMTTPNDEVFKWIDQVRARAGLDGVQDSWTQHSNRPAKFTTQAGMREIIHRERLNELAFEGEGWWDLLRWKEAETEMSKPVQGWNVTGEETADYYVVKTIATRRFTYKDYLYPIRQAAFDINPNLVQNPGW